MIYFVTNREDHQVTLPRASIDDVIDYCSEKPMLGFDKEFNGLDPFRAIRLLTVVGDEENQFVIDDTSVDISPLEFLTNKVFIGHNIKIDYQMAKFQGVTLKKIYDTMIVEQRLGLGSGRKNSLDAVIQRRLGLDVSKDVRSEFMTMHKDSVFYDRHVNYAAIDIIHLFAIHEKQQPYIKKFNMELLIFEIELPLVLIIGECELQGFVMNKKKWRENIVENKAKLKDFELAMDNSILSMIDKQRAISMSDRDYKLLLAKYGASRSYVEIIQFDLFGEDKVIEAKSFGKINYRSSKQVKELFNDLGLPIPTKDGTESVNVALLNSYLTENPESPFKDFLDLYLQYSTINKELTTYGEKFLKMINPVSGKLHTVFRQCVTETGRFASGNSKEGYPNMQNIKRDNKFRHCFGLEEGYEMTTSDLTGAELCIMVALSGDVKLLEISKGDMHSYMANLCWSNIFKHRNLLYTESDVISKKQHKEKRDAFKPLTFGAIYGLKKKRAAQSLIVTEEEGQIVVDSIKQEIPTVFSMVETNAARALQNGYIIHNTRTNSRRWFTPVLEASKLIREMCKTQPDGIVPGLPFQLKWKNAKPSHVMSFIERVEVEGAARNSSIQGTQSDLVKEAIVEIDKHIKQFKWDLHLLMQVHDELCYSHPIGYKVICPYRNIEVIAKDYIAKAMCEVSNRYLNGVLEMEAEAHTMLTWNK